VLRDRQLQRSKLEWLVHRRLRQVLISAYRHVPYYREQMKKAGYDPALDYGGPEDLRRLPAISKSTIKGIGTKQFVREGSDLARCYSGNTSGSTGIPLQVYKAPYERALQIAKWLRVLFANGYSMRDRVMSISNPADVAFGHSALQRIGLLRRKAVDYQGHPPEEMVDIFLSCRPDVLYGNRCHLVLMALELEKRDQQCEGLKLLAATAEEITESHRALFRKAFGVEVVESYGSAEMGVMAYETPARDGLHLCEDLTYFEFLDAEGRPVAPGVPGRVVVTDLAGSLMPFIRYDQGDLAAYQLCDIGDGARERRLARIVGRDCDLFQLSDGTLRPCLDAVNPIRQYEGIEQFQCIQRTHQRFDLLLVADPTYLEGIRDPLLNDLHGAFPKDVKFEIIPVDRIKPGPSGKVRQAVSEILGADRGGSR
jgi:phenylacetate-CoA ligase